MCDECEKFEDTIARYRRLRDGVDDQTVHEAADRLIADLQGKIAALHPEPSRNQNVSPPTDLQ